MRRTATITAACAFAGCSFSTSLPKETGDDAGIDAKMIDGPPDDIDADGVKNVSDNCPDVANPQQFNEDGDTRGDECDPCPQLAAAADDVDDDGDKIGNGCDPRPAMAGDVLAYWNGFHVASSGLPAGMTLVHGNAMRWSVANGTLLFDRNNDDWGMPVVDVGAGTHTADSTFQVTAVFTGAQAAGVAVDIAANDTDLFLCEARLDIQGREMWRRNPAAFDGWSALGGQSATTPIDIYRIALQRTATDLACTTKRLNQMAVPLSDGTDALGNTRAGLFARNADVAFQYLAVYTSP